jgi:hypothetical protein
MRTTGSSFFQYLKLKIAKKINGQAAGWRTVHSSKKDFTKVLRVKVASFAFLAGRYE